MSQERREAMYALQGRKEDRSMQPVNETSLDEGIVGACIIGGENDKIKTTRVFEETKDVVKESVMEIKDLLLKKK